MKPKRMLLLAAVLLLSLSPMALAQDTNSYRKSQTAQVELFVTSWCPYCRDARAFLDREGISYRVYDVERDADAARRKQQLAPGRGVPFAIINGTAVSGWSEQAYRAALGG